MTIAIYVNGKKEEVAGPLSIQGLLETKKIRPEVVTVELNDKIIDKKEYPQILIQANDRIEFVYYMGGGFPSLCSGVYS